MVEHIREFHHIVNNIKRIEAIQEISYFEMEEHMREFHHIVNNINRIEVIQVISYFEWKSTLESFIILSIANIKRIEAIQCYHTLNGRAY